MKALFGLELRVGHHVGYTTRGRYNYTLRGIVVGFTPKRVKVLGPDGKIVSNLHPELVTISMLGKRKDV